MPGMQRSLIRRRQSIYVLMLITLTAGYAMLWGKSWHVSFQLLTSVEWMATVASLCVGAVALVRFYSRREINFLFIGTGFIANGLLSGIHAAMISSYFIDITLPISLDHIAWSWYASRLFLPVLLWLSWIFWGREKKYGKGYKISDQLVYVVVGAIALTLFLSFNIASLRDAFPRSDLVTEYREVLPALFFVLSIVGYYRKEVWKTDPFDHWLIISMMLGLLAELTLLPLFQWNYDVSFSLSFLVRLICYICTFIGLLFNIYLLFSESLTHKELVFKNTLLTTQQEASQDAILVVDKGSKIISYNQHFVELWGLSDEMLKKRDDGPVLAHVVGQVANPDEFLARVKYLYEHKLETSVEEILLKDGRIIDRYSSPINGEDASYFGRVWYFRDITEKKRYEQRIKESENKFRGLIEQSLVGIAMIEDAKFSYANRKFSEIFGYEISELMKISPPEMAVDEDKSIIDDVIRDQLEREGQGEEFTFHGRHKFGAVVNIEGRYAHMTVNDKPALMFIILDVTERHKAESEVQILQARLREQAIRDPLTGLFNRRYLDEVIMSELARAERGHQPLSLVMCDIDYFKDINDNYGHLAGDEVLRAFSRLIKQYSRGGDIICRYGGEEFLLILPNMAREAAIARAEQIRLAFAAALMSYNATVIRATASFGVAAFPDDGHEIDVLIAAADKALYAAKHGGRNQVMIYAA